MTRGPRRRRELPGRSEGGALEEVAVLAERTREHVGQLSARAATGPSAAAVLGLCDGLGALVAVVLASAVTPWAPRAPRGQLAFVGLVGAAVLVSFQVVRIFPGGSRRVVPSTVEDLGRAALGSALAVMTLLSVVALTGLPLARILSPKSVLLAGLFVVLLAPASRAVGLLACDEVGARRSKVVVVGTGTIASDVAARLRRARLVDFVGYVDDDPTPHQPVLGGLASLDEICRRHGADRVVVAFSRAHPETVAASLRSVAPWVAITVIPRYFDITGWQAKLGDLGGLPTVDLGSRPGAAAGAVKRTTDVVVAALGLVIALPLLAAASLEVRLSSPGPVLFRQPRLGRHRVPFEVLKLRTMREPEAGEDPLDPAAEARRVTALGALLRRSGIDELPQLVNVLRGDMSLVGPRPFVEHECRGFPAWAEERFAMRPGMTGLWQVCGQHELRQDELFRLDTQYVRSWSFWSDLRILLRTPGRLLHGGGDRSAFRGGAALRPGTAETAEQS